MDEHLGPGTRDRTGTALIGVWIAKAIPMMLGTRIGNSTVKDGKHGTDHCREAQDVAMLYYERCDLVEYAGGTAPVPPLFLIEHLAGAGGRAFRRSTTRGEID